MRVWCKRELTRQSPRSPINSPLSRLSLSHDVTAMGCKRRSVPCLAHTPNVERARRHHPRSQRRTSRGPRPQSLTDVGIPHVPLPFSTSRTHLSNSPQTAFQSLLPSVPLELTPSSGPPVSQGRGEVHGPVERAEYLLDVAESAVGDVSSADTDKSALKRDMTRVPVGSPWKYAFSPSACGPPS